MFFNFCWQQTANRELTAQRGAQTGHTGTNLPLLIPEESLKVCHVAIHLLVIQLKVFACLWDVGVKKIQHVLTNLR